jgi:hypothetical protein
MIRLDFNFHKTDDYTAKWPVRCGKSGAMSREESVWELAGLAQRAIIAR